MFPFSYETHYGVRPLTHCENHTSPRKDTSGHHHDRSPASNRQMRPHHHHFHRSNYWSPHTQSSAQNNKRPPKVVPMPHHSVELIALTDLVAIVAKPDEQSQLDAHCVRTHHVNYQPFLDTIGYTSMRGFIHHLALFVATTNSDVYGSKIVQTVMALMGLDSRGITNSRSYIDMADKREAGESIKTNPKSVLTSVTLPLLPSLNPHSQKQTLCDGLDAMLIM